MTDTQLAVLGQNARCNRPDIDLPTILKHKSAAEAANTAVLHCASQGLVSRDERLANAASVRGIPFLPLETYAQVNRQRLAVPEYIHRFQLMRAFTPESREGLRRAVHALNTGAYDEITKALDDLAASPVDAETYKRLMITDRNRAWTLVLIKYLDEGYAVVNVGAAHLPGPNGLIALLRERGYRVEPILLPAH